MPNHFHAIFNLKEIPPAKGVGAGLPRPYVAQSPTLGQVVGYLKYQSTKFINEIRHTPGVPVWQRNYYEHIIRNEEDLSDIREYIANNPAKWLEDENHPDNMGKKVSRREKPAAIKSK